jgi:hypothetical protein
MTAREKRIAEVNARLPEGQQLPADYGLADEVIMCINFLIATLVIGTIMYDMIVTRLLKGLF